MELAFAVACFALSGFVQGVSGFGSGMVLMALLPALWDVRECVVLSALFSLVLNSGLTWYLRRDCEAREVVPIALGGLAGVPIGVAFLAHVDGTLVTRVLGGVLIVFGLWQLRGGASSSVSCTIRWAPIAGLLSGVTAGAYNVGAPALLVYGEGRDWQRDAYRANLQASFLAMGIFLVVNLVSVGLIDEVALHRFALLAPAGALGGFVGARMATKIPQRQFRRLVLILVVCMGVGYVT